MILKESSARLSWWLRRCAKTVGWMGGAAAAAAIAAAVMQWHLLQIERDALKDTRAALMVLRQRTAQAHAAVELPGPAQMLAEFSARLPAVPTDASIETLAGLHAVARAQGLVLQQGSYRLVTESAEAFAYVEVVMSAKGNYPQLRRFILHALAELPSLALTAARFSRQSVSDANVEGEFRFWVFLRRPA